jgi:4-aminobutyrate aminotransferase
MVARTVQQVAGLELLSPVWSHLTTIQPERAEGIYIYDTSGNRYTDFTSGIGVTNTGHCHPRVVAAIQEQAAKMLHGQILLVVPQVTLDLAAALRELTPAALDCFFFSNSGAEAIEGAVKLARHYTKRTNIVVFQNSFLGRSHMTMAMSTSKTVYRQGYQPLPSGVFIAPFPYAYRWGWDEDTAVDFCIKELHHLFKSQTTPQETAAIFIEPVLGEGGYLPVPDRFMRELRKICSDNGILLVADEIQSGFGRTGDFWGYEHSGIEPDVIVMAKGLASGMPMSAIAAPKKVMDSWVTGTHGGTYAGSNLVSIAAALASVKVIREEKLAENAAKMGERLMDGLSELQGRYPVMGDVRGRGLMVGVEFTRDGEPDKATAKAVQAACIQNRLLLLTCGTNDNVIRWIPPLVVNAPQIDEALTVFDQAISSVGM